MGEVAVRAGGPVRSFRFTPRNPVPTGTLYPNLPFREPGEFVPLLKEGRENSPSSAVQNVSRPS